ncbi:FAD:protein FMN transferase [Actinotalea sp. M2MS4P-6]|uniref:FAD:protein FMN transferase n=1 Tax=Actinotalea sp. M2MS4P-6 TaxID=2983762 RepID=UPI0021E40273|nr:FAD:protein FMN transferase [Actinotalea sp. M2MS4P-6]MCV2393078.1 FAD:protein FMN transferase [Actinotalea sp. M2MS4P-6]
MSVRAAARERSVTFRSMASDVELRVVDPRPDADRAIAAARARIEAVARHLTRFEQTSALSRANATPDTWHQVPRELADAVNEAQRAYRETGGLFDPRVLAALLTWGYDRTFADVVGSTDPAALPGVPDGAGAVARPVPTEPWEPFVIADGADQALLQLGGTPIDLGGIGKGLAVRWAAAELSDAGTSVLVDAGGDEWLGGAGPDGDGWKVGVEDPLAGGDGAATDRPGAGRPASTPPAPEDPVLVLSVTDLAVATSSVRRRRWRAEGHAVHHLVDPRRGLPGGAGLASVTVLHADPAWAEVWSKSLFLTGAVEVAAQAEVRGLAAAWVTDDGSVHTSAAMDPAVIWRAR